MITDSDINLLYHIMKRFGCPEPLKENEYDEQYPELYGEAASREPDISVRKTLVDCLVLIASSSRVARDIMRKRKVYPLVRDYFKTAGIEIIPSGVWLRASQTFSKQFSE